MQANLQVHVIRNGLFKMCVWIRLGVPTNQHFIMSRGKSICVWKELGTKSDAALAVNLERTVATVNPKALPPVWAVMRCHHGYSEHRS